MSWQMHVIAAYARLWRRPRTYGSAASAAAFLRRPKHSAAPHVRLTKLRHHRIGETRYGDYTCYTVHPPGQPDVQDSLGSTIYVHGGGYVTEIAVEHWSLIADIATATGRPVHVPIYGLAPDHDALEAHAFLREVLADLTSGGPVHLAGDSAGGGLALAVTQQWLADGGDPPTGLTLISPWLDATVSNPAIPTLAHLDPWLSVEALHVIAEAWAGPLDIADPRVSPLHGDLSTLPPVDLYVGTRDILQPDCPRLRDEAPEGRVSYTEEPGALHVYPLLPAPEGRRARAQLLTRLSARLRP
ncbi:alpha/beta hydrolase fold domain-containing protein [Mycolicibacterium sp. BiH015]|uniref:alpha/beta hydrolase fold domain-containing protein n=1 Tax=Mycolicibacterium sp. BiH015 TaxID=3018808 RepID=UPI0022E431DA|nr:alpha/beta hydrolase fold domain-containing protein [Mycolicibacterium sp. BiH015]MDA2893350.1 alpha/beta hydrolase fold domain-containing protein [Mycolicibacterium sp. BiH015]